MADEPSNGELGRQLDRVQLLLQSLIGRAEYSVRQDGIDQRFTGLSGDVQALRSKHDEDVNRLHERIDEHEKTAREGRFHWQQVLIPCAVALIVAIIGVLGELWVAGMRK